MTNIEQHIIKDTIICGDFNSHNPVWGSTKIDQNGQMIDNYNLVCINNGEGTRINLPQLGTTSCLDITQLI